MMDFFGDKEILDIKDFFDIELIWIEILEIPYYATKAKTSSTVSIIMSLNDWPDELMYTLYYKEQCISFDDLPIKWKIIYDSHDNYEKEKKRILET